MNYLAVAGDYMVWWYSGGSKRLYLWLSALFGWLNNFFSIKRVFKTLFSPWKRLVGEKKAGLAGFRDFLIDNLVSRFVGFMFRLIVIFIYIISIFFLFVFSVVSFVFWVSLPVLIVVSIINIFVSWKM
jgi:hypothetical protein